MIRIRTQREIGLIANSCQIVADTLDMLSAYVKPGAHIINLDEKAEKFISDNTIYLLLQGEQEDMFFLH